MNWTVIGINYQKANLEQRQKYALDEEQMLRAYDVFLEADIRNALILSTCNRTEFFIPSTSNAHANEILASKVYGTDMKNELFHTKHDDSATDYFFRICSGLESQIVGDFEILGQAKKAIALAKKHGMLSGTWERTINNGLSAAKKARTQTGFYSGASSTSYACIEHLKNSDIDLKKAKYLILGTGKIGLHTIDHLLKFAPPENVTVANRSFEKALDIANRKGLKVMPMQHLKHESENYDVIICATNAPNYIVTKELLTQDQPHQIIDLSVPMNVDPKIKERDNITLVNVDELSVIINQNMIKRDGERAHVERIIAESINDLNAWFTIKRGMPILSELKAELQELKAEALSNVSADNIEHSSAFLDEYTDELFNQLSQKWIKKVRNKPSDAN